MTPVQSRTVPVMTPCVCAAIGALRNALISASNNVLFIPVSRTDPLLFGSVDRFTTPYAPGGLYPRHRRGVQSRTRSWLSRCGFRSHRVHNPEPQNPFEKTGGCNATAPSLRQRPCACRGCVYVHASADRDRRR